MKIIYTVVILLFLIGTHELRSLEDKTGNLTIEINKFKNNSGQARITIFEEKDAKSFPTKPENAYKKFKKKIVNNLIFLELKDLPFGNYAICIHHDEDGDNEINTNWMGIPNEGFGISNNATGSFGPPSYADSEISIDKDSLHITIDMNY